MERTIHLFLILLVILENILIPSYVIDATNAARAATGHSRRTKLNNVPRDQIPDVQAGHNDSDLAKWNPFSNITLNGSAPYDALGMNEREHGMTSDSMAARLFRDFKQVDTMRYVRPVSRSSTGETRINISLSLLKINDMVDKDEKLTTTVRLKVEWFDDRLRWNKTTYGGLEIMHLPGDMLWMPELELMNGFGYTHIDISKQMVRVFYNGTVSIRRVMHLDTGCTLDVTFYPYDYQTCDITIGSWNWNINELLFLNDGMSVDDYKMSMLWNLVGTWNKSTILSMNETESDDVSCVVFTLYLNREDAFYNVYLIWPTVVLALLTCLAFFLPGDAGETIGLAVSLLLTFTVYLLFTADKMPENSRSMPLLGIILMILLMFSAASILFNVILLVWHHLGESKDLGWCLKKSVFCCIGSFTCKYLLDREPRGGTRKEYHRGISGKIQSAPGPFTTNLTYDTNTVNRPENEITGNMAYMSQTRLAPSDQVYPSLPVPHDGHTVMTRTPVPEKMDINIDTFENPPNKYKHTYVNAAKILTRFIGSLYLIIILGGVIFSFLVIANLPSTCWKNRMECTPAPDSAQ